MARITIEDCLRQIPNRFLLVNMVAKRVRQIREGSEYLVSSPKNEDVVVSLREIAAGKLALKHGSDEEEIEETREISTLEEVESLMTEEPVNKETTAEVPEEPSESTEEDDEN